ncbi:MAG: 2-oxo acid dehydrogenase subunit E2 [Acidimicrobiales bacterium]
MQSETKNDVTAISAAHRTAARRMQQSKQNAPHFYLQTSLDAAPMTARRNAAGATKIAWDAFFAWASARALEKFPRLKMRYENENLVAPESDAVGVAVDLDGDLYVVSLEAPAAKTPEQISEELRDAVRKLRDGDAAARGLKPALMTISNLGAANVESFIAIINPPQSCILAVGKIADVPVANNDKIEIGKRATLSPSASSRWTAAFINSFPRPTIRLPRPNPFLLGPSWCIRPTTARPGSIRTVRRCAGKNGTSAAATTWRSSTSRTKPFLS